ncbi:hypothetical protein EV183_000270 [Coemansia sp. RSA 2336]|nr:hypothetical protein EV183_000270 [Coemansia sp. RSA 2336]
MKLRTTALACSAYFCIYRACVEAEALSLISLSLESEHLADTWTEPDTSLLNEHLSSHPPATTSTDPSISISFIDEGILMPSSTAPTIAEDSEVFTGSDAMSMTAMSLPSEPPNTSLEVSTEASEPANIDSSSGISSAESESLTDTPSTGDGTSSDTLPDTTEETSTDKSTVLSESTDSSVKSDNHSTSSPSPSTSSHSTTSHSTTSHSMHTVVEVITTYVDGSASKVTKTTEEPNDQHGPGTSTVTIDGEDVIVTGTATARDITSTSASHPRACYSGAVQAALLAVLYLLLA